MAGESSPVASSSVATRKRPEWLAWAVGSGAFAAFNGVFAKLTTGSSTESIVASISHIFGVSHSSFLDIVIRAMFFGLNQLSNIIMWILFTRALTAASSTTQVSILNTSANFMVTAVLGLIVFGEKLPLGWWAGASLLIAGTVVIGAQKEEEKSKAGGADTTGAESVGLQDADTVAKTLGAGGVEENVSIAGRFKDDPDDPDDPITNASYSDDQPKRTNDQ